ncbi:hypothetical protein BH23PSE2_BH23PSE2_10970 [soil metagenome]
MLLRIAFAASLLALATAGCNRPPEPPTDAPPAPQATRLHDAIQTPIDKARAVEDTVQDAADRQRAEIDAASG